MTDTDNDTMHDSGESVPPISTCQGAVSDDASVAVKQKR